MSPWFIAINKSFDRFEKIRVRARALVVFAVKGYRLKKVGVGCKIRGAHHIALGTNVSIGDYCWIEAIYTYKGIKFKPRLWIGDNVALSDFVHISCAHDINIGADCLIGSKVFIGDHNHGSTHNEIEILSVAPAKRALCDVMEITIGEKCWICDGVVILAGTQLAPCSIIAANSVVRLTVDRPALIAGAPARVIRYFD